MNLSVSDTKETYCNLNGVLNIMGNSNQIQFVNCKIKLSIMGNFNIIFSKESKFQTTINGNQNYIKAASSTVQIGVNGDKNKVQQIQSTINVTYINGYQNRIDANQDQNQFRNIQMNSNQINQNFYNRYYQPPLQYPQQYQYFQYPQYINSKQFYHHNLNMMPYSFSELNRTNSHNIYYQLPNQQYIYSNNHSACYLSNQSERPRTYYKSQNRYQNKKEPKKKFRNPQSLDQSPYNQHMPNIFKKNSACVSEKQVFHNTYANIYRQNNYSPKNNQPIEQQIEWRQPRIRRNNNKSNTNGLKKIEIQCLPISSHSQFTVSPCSICLQDIRFGDQQMFLPCFHSFHLKCSIQWLTKSQKCPICQTDIKEAVEKLRYKQNNL